MSTTTRNVLLLGAAGVVGLFIGGIGLRGVSPIVPLLILAGVGFYLYKMLSGNQKVIKATPEERDAALAVSVAPPPGMGVVYVYRDGFVGKALGIDVQLDGMVLAQLKSPRFTAVQLPAGSYTLAAGPRGFAASQANAGAVQFNLLPGERAVFRLEMAMGALKNTVRIVREDAPLLAMAKLTRIQMVMPRRAVESLEASPQRAA